MGEKIKEVCSKLDRSWVIGIVTILLVLGLVVSFLMGNVQTQVFVPVVMYVLGFFTPNRGVEKLVSGERKT